MRMINRGVHRPGATAGMDAGYDTAEFVAARERRGIRAQVARKGQPQRSRWTQCVARATR